MATNESHETTHPNPTRERYWTPDEVAELLRITPTAVRAWVRKGRLRGYRLGDHRGAVRIPDSAVLELLERSAS